MATAAFCATRASFAAPTRADAARGCARAIWCGAIVTDDRLGRAQRQSRHCRACGDAATVGDEALVALARHCPALERIDVRGCARVTEVGIEACEGLPNCKLYVQRDHL